MGWPREVRVNLLLSGLHLLRLWLRNVAVAAVAVGNVAAAVAAAVGDVAVAEGDVAASERPVATAVASWSFLVEHFLLVRDVFVEAVF